MAVGGVAAATFQHRVRAPWYGWFSALVATLGALAVVDTVSTGTGGIFSDVAFFAGGLLWIVVTSVLMVREND